MKARSEKVEEGEILSMHNYYKVTKKDKDYIHCTDEHGQAVRISNAIVDGAMTSTSQFEVEKKVTCKELAEKMMELGHSAFKVVFQKQVEAKTIADNIDATELAVASQTKRRRLIKELMVGETRVMHARLWRSDDGTADIEMGRFKVVDLEASIPGKTAYRLVDSRTISELVVEGVRYFV